MQAGGDVQHANKPDEQGGKSCIPTGEKMPIRDSSLHSSLLNFTEQKNSTALCSTLPDGGSVQSRTADLASDTSVDEVVTHEHLVASAKEVCEQPVLLASASEPSISGMWDFCSAVLQHTHPKHALPKHTHAHSCCFFVVFFSFNSYTLVEEQ